ncbi:helix-turn-helix domain-containing protein [Pseudaestuariivita rosea]|uniref:helix-turn-helix domain-containing protein n=1 Tax=Pseudaestuariivita rosea TaxID=2763263 RepID=UPI001ABA4654|nr:helix-turn-helix domain-containing protein [Pseudaestuariivita rosea]
MAERDLWFLPAPVEEAAWDMPGPWVDRRSLVDPDAWRRAERAQGRALVAAATAVARLDERLRQGAWQGALDRLALEEASALTWTHGVGISADKLALYDLLRLTFAADHQRALPLAHWAHRRLSGVLTPREGLAAFLGRHPVKDPAPEMLALMGRAVGEYFDLAAEEWLSGLDVDLHPISRGALAAQSWQLLDLSVEGAAIEGSVAAARIGAEGLNFLPFLPIGLGAQRVRPSAGVSNCLTQWYASVETGALQALMMLDQLQHWQARAHQVTRGLKGRTPGRLIEALLCKPAVSVAMLSEMADVSRAAALRNLTWFEDHGLTREITGQGRFRLWRADVAA